ncbi:MAG: MBL fold metallo-hydrolase [Desulfobulbus sp.]|nr:MBL fold metallo-hydrolase [Desulfobulbus sp.]
MHRLYQRILPLATPLIFCIASWVQAQIPFTPTQVPGYYRMQLGRFEITALYDGAVQLETKLLQNVEQTDLKQMLAKMFVGNPKMQTAVNGYLINTGEHLVLVDAGAGSLFGENLGALRKNMKASGYRPDQVDTLILTHMHGDHIGGLNDEEDRPLFANATVWVAKMESGYWLSEQMAASAPKERQHAFAVAQEAAAPYQAEKRWQTFDEGTVLVPGIRAVKAGGHTPGHTAFAVESEGKKLLIWGDIVHAHAVQFARPEVSIDFDVDQQQAVTTRKALLQQVAARGELVAGMHLPFPGIGHVRAEGEGRYGWVPIEFAPLPTRNAN